MRWLFVIFAAALLAWAGIGSVFRDHEGWLNARVCLPLAASLTSVILAATFPTRLRVAACWFALSILGHAMALQLIDAGRDAGYHHYFPTSEWSRGSHVAFTLGLIFQACMVGVGVWRNGREIGSWLLGHFKIWQLVCIGLTIFLPAAVLSEDPRFYVNELFVASLIIAINLANITLAVRSIPKSSVAAVSGFLNKVVGRETDSTSAPVVDRFCVSVAAWVLAVAALLSVFVYERHPHVPDEVVYLYHSRFFADGQLTRPIPKVPEAFEIFLMQFDEDRWYPAPAPGWPLVLSIGTLLGVPWLVNPILAAINVVLTYLLLTHMYSRQLARLSLLLLAVSPWYLFLGMSYMTHVFALTCMLTAACGVAITRHTGNPVWSWLGGLALGVMALIRPLEALGVAVVLGLWAIGLGGKRIPWLGTVGLVLASMFVGAAVPVYNSAITGDARTFPIMLYADEVLGEGVNRYGFGPDRGLGWATDPNPGHDVVDALINSNLNTAVISFELFGWSIGSLAFFGVAVFSMRYRASDLMLLGVCFVIYWLHFFNYFAGGPDFGARYWFLMIIPLVALSARGAEVLQETLNQDESQGDCRIWIAIGCLSLSALINFVPWRSIDKYFHYRGMRADIRKVAKTHNFQSDLILIRGEGHPDFTSAAVYNSSDFDDPTPLYAWERNPEVRRQVIAAYPRSKVWILNGPSKTGAGYEVVAGPLTPEQASQFDE